MAAEEHDAVDRPRELNRFHDRLQVVHGCLADCARYREVRMWWPVGVKRLAADRVVELERQLADLLPSVGEPQPGHATTPTAQATAGVSRRDIESSMRSSDPRDGRRDQLDAAGISRTEEYEREMQLVRRQPPDLWVDRANFGERLPDARGGDLGQWRRDEQAPVRRVRQ